MNTPHVLLVNGSPHREGCTYTALKEVADTLETNGVSTLVDKMTAARAGAQHGVAAEVHRLG